MGRSVWANCVFVRLCVYCSRPLFPEETLGGKKNWNVHDYPPKQRRGENGLTTWLLVSSGLVLPIIRSAVDRIGS